MMIRKLFVALALLCAGLVPALADFPDQATYAGVGGGTANAQTLTLANAASYADLLGVLVKYTPNVTNTSAATLTVNSFGTSPSFRKRTGGGLQALTGQELVAATPVLIMYDGTFFDIMSSGIGAATTVGGYQKLIVTATSNTQATITANALTVVDTSGAAYRITSASVTCAITTSGLNGLDTGSEASSTWYSIWDIYNPATLTNGCLLSVSATTPTLPSGYTAEFRAGWVRNDSGSNFWRTIQYGPTAQIEIGTNPSGPVVLASGSASTWTAISVSSFVPSTASEITGYLATGSPGTSQAAQIAPNNSYSSGPVYSITTNTVDPANSTLLFRFSLESTNVYYGSSSSSASVAVLGWVDNL